LLTWEGLAFEAERDEAYKAAYKVAAMARLAKLRKIAKKAARWFRGRRSGLFFGQ
jgi:hypothetical protein